MGVTLEDVIGATDQLLAVYPDNEGALRAFTELGQLTGEVASSYDIQLMAAARSRLGRCLRRLESRFGASGAQPAVESLSRLEERLSRAITEADLRLESERLALESEHLRSRILHELAREEPVRPRELAQRLNVDPSQISRALRILREEEKVELSPFEGEDRRSHFYRLASKAKPRITAHDERGMGPRASGPVSSEGLSEREIVVMRLVASGLNNNEIAQRLTISARTVKAHLEAIFAKIAASESTPVAASNPRAR